MEVPVGNTLGVELSTSKEGECVKNHSELLRESGLKATIQRLSILEILQETGHSTIDDIYATVRKKHASISLATVYKNIEMLLKKGVLVEVPLTGTKSKYEIKKHDHIHLICQVCGSVEDETMDAIPQEQLACIAQKDDFILSQSQINLYGICRNCR